MAKAQYFYGTHAVQALLEYRPLDALELFVQIEKKEESSIHPSIILAQQMGVSIQYASKDKLTALCHSPQHQGIVVHARPLTTANEALLTDLSQQENCLLLILDQITDAHNLGACLRTAAAMGVDAVICPKHHSANLTPTVAKVSVGASEIIPVIMVTNLARCIQQLQQAGVFVFGTILNEVAKPITDVNFTGKIAVIMGSEGEGMRRLTTENCDELVYIPMIGNRYGNLQSLNVSVATGMVLYEISRQRNQQ